MNFEHCLTLHDLFAPSSLIVWKETEPITFAFTLPDPCPCGGGVYGILYISYLERHVAVLFGGMG